MMHNFCSVRFQDLLLHQLLFSLFHPVPTIFSGCHTMALLVARGRYSLTNVCKRLDFALKHCSNEEFLIEALRILRLPTLLLLKLEASGGTSYDMEQRTTSIVHLNVQRFVESWHTCVHDTINFVLCHVCDDASKGKSFVCSSLISRSVTPCRGQSLLTSNRDLSVKSLGRRLILESFLRCNIYIVSCRCQRMPPTFYQVGQLRQLLLASLAVVSGGLRYVLDLTQAISGCAVLI